MKTEIPSVLIAPCGMNCGICKFYLRYRHKCAGCNIETPFKPRHCLVCSIKLCPERGESQFCYGCKKYPCARLRQLDKRYRTKYSMSMVENLNNIRESGLERFMESENSRWVCPVCGNPLCVHDHKCYQCESSPADE
ncbi:MAG: DUF3795 domain-containing protein [Bacteroidota bacterium]